MIFIKVMKTTTGIFKYILSNALSLCDTISSFVSECTYLNAIMHIHVGTRLSV